MTDFSLVQNLAKEYMQLNHPDRNWYIVGGALRDTELSKPVKDIDIFVVGYDADLLPPLEAEDGDRNAYLLRAYTEVFKGMEVNLIFMRGADWSLARMTDRCDFGICQIGWCPVQDRVYRSDDYKCDVANKTLTLCRETPAERLGRMQSKFEDYALFNPSGILFDSPKSWSYSEAEGKMVLR